MRDPILEIRLFGQPAVHVCGADLTHQLSRRAVWLLAILVLRQGEPIERTALAGLLWPDSTEEGSLHNLRQTLAVLRKVLGPAKDCVGSASLRSLFFLPSSSTWVDVLEFDSLCTDGTPAALEKALALYRESLLTGCDEPFVEAWREFRANQFLEAAERVGSHHASENNHGAASRVFRRILSQDPFRESACRLLMNSLASLGDVAAALELCREFRQRLRRELRTEL